MSTLAAPSRTALLDAANNLSALPPHDQVYLDWQRRWRETARPNQIVRDGDWTEMGFLAGRGFGKTRVGAEWITRATYEDPTGFDACVIAPTYQDVKFTCFEGESGILSVLPPELLVEYNKSDLTLKLRNIVGGVTTIRGFTAEKPERLRGPQHCRGWFDELAAWQYDEDTWDMAWMGMRLGDSPQVVWTTTPKPKALIRSLSQPADRRVIVRGSTYDNRSNLPDTFFKQLEKYEGTVLGRQELEGELIDPEESGIIKRSWFRLWPNGTPLPRFDWIILSLDTAYTEKNIDKKGDADPTACSVWGVFHHEKRSNVMLLDCWEDHLGLPDLLRRVKKELNVSYGEDEDQALIKPMFGSAKPMTSGRKPDICLIEDKGSGISLRQMLGEAGIEAYAYNPGRADKVSRLHIVSPIFAQKRVWVPESAKHPGKPRTWCDPLIAQLCSFTGEGSTKHDDHVDSTTQALRLCMDRGLISLIKEPTPTATPPRKVGANPYAA